MSTDFDWPGAPEGERYRRDYGDDGWEYYVIRAHDEVVFWDRAEHRWDESSYAAIDLRRILAFERVQSTRPTIVNVGDRVRVEGTVVGVNTEYRWANVTDASQRTHAVSFDDLEVLQRADPPLQPGDLVRANGCIWQFADDDRFALLLDDTNEAAWDTSYRTRDQLPGPLVKVSYRSRSKARKVLQRDVFQGEAMNAYACPLGNGFHVGHLPRAIRTGATTRQAKYGGVR